MSECLACGHPVKLHGKKGCTKLLLTDRGGRFCLCKSVEAKKEKGTR